MAAKRISKSAVDWAKFAELVPKTEMHQFRVFKAHTDAVIASIDALPAELPTIDFNAYKSKLSDKSFVDAIQADYNKLAAKIPYPKNDAIKASIKEQQAQHAKDIEEFSAKASKDLERYKKELSIIETVPDPHRMTRQMYVDYFPELRIPEEEPSYYPFRDIDQPGCPGVEEATVKPIKGKH